MQSWEVRAVGEIGLDYHWDTEPREIQKHWFIRQLELAAGKNLPVNIHSRDAAEDTMEIMKPTAKEREALFIVFLTLRRWHWNM